MGPGAPSNMQHSIPMASRSLKAQQQQHLYEAQQQQLVGATREQEMFTNFELQQLQQQKQSQHHQRIDLMRCNRGFDVTGPSGQQVNTTGFTHLTGPSNMAPSLALGGSYDNAMHNDGASGRVGGGFELVPLSDNEQNELFPLTFNHQSSYHSSHHIVKLRLLKPAKLNQENMLNPTLDRSLLPIKDGE
ncbi:hypothetical protein Tco_0046830 [Tanacetum coccineum]